MLVALSYCPKDQDQAERLAKWTLDLGGAQGHELLILRDTRCHDDGRLLHDFDMSFDRIERIDFVDHYDKWPDAPNTCFATIARHIASTKPQPWLWLEPDIVPLKSGWLDSIAEEYARAGKLFMGDFVDVPNVPPHMSGIGCYPGEVVQHAGATLIAGDVAFDVVGAPQILPLMHKSELIMHSWKHEPFESADQIQREIFDFKQKCVLFHADKSGSLIELLRQKNLPVVPVLAEPESSTRSTDRNRRVSGEARESNAPADIGMSDSRGGWQIICDILIKSYPADYEWLRYCLQSIDKFGGGFRKIVIVIPTGTQPDKVFGEGFDGFPVAVIETTESGDSYLYQQAVKASAHEFTDADYILHVDSDCVFQRPFSPADFFNDGKPVWYVTPYEAVAVPWRAPTEKFIGERVQFEFMRRLPQLVPRALHLAVAAFCLARHKVRLTDYILSQPDRAFSEFNALGALAWLRDRGDFHWVDTTTVDMPPVFAKQYRSYDGITDETRAEIEKVLSGGVESRHAEWPSEEACQCTGHVRRNPVKGSQVSMAGSECFDPSKGLVDREDTSSGDSVPPVQNISDATSRCRQTKEGWWIIDGDTHISKWVEEEGRLDHDRWLLDRILPLIPEGGVVVDGGAFIGDHTIAYTQQAGPYGTVYAFEANRVAFECLMRNVPGDGHSDRYNSALSSTPHERLRLSLDDNAGASSLADSGEIVMTSTIDNVLLDRRSVTRCDFIKLDIEGCELEALRGAERTIAKFKPILLLEVNTGALARQGTSPQELFKWLEDHGYSHTPIQQLQIVDSPQYDVLCRPVANSADNIIQPWQSKPESLDEIMLHASRLKEFCTAPSYTRQVREKLREAGVIK